MVQTVKSRDAVERRHDGGIALLTFRKKGNGAGGAFL